MKIFARLSACCPFLDPVIAIVFLTAPYYYVRMHGFDFSQGSSLSLVDPFLFLALLKAIWVLAGEFKKTKCENLQGARGFAARLKETLGKETLYFLLVAAFFGFWGLLSAPVGRLFYSVPEPLAWPQVLSAVSQYGFLMAAFPLVAKVFLTTSLQRLWAVRLVALGYLVPTIINLALTPYDSPAFLRNMFFAVRRAIGTYGNANSYAYVLLITLPLYAYLAVQEKEKKWRLLGMVGLVASLLCLLLAGSFGSWIALTFLCLANVLLVLFWRKHPVFNHKKKAWFFGGRVVLFSLLGFLGLILYYPPIMRDIVWRIGPVLNIKESQTNYMVSLLGYGGQKAPEGPSNTEELSPLDKMGSSRQRIQMMTRAYNLIIQRSGGLFFGHGLRQTFALPEFHFFGNALDVHVLYLLLWLEGGLVLAATYLVFLGLLFRQAFLYVKKDPAMAIAFGASVFAVFLICGINPHLYLRYYWAPLLPVFALYSGKTKDERA